jgi:transposase
VAEENRLQQHAHPAVRASLERVIARLEAEEAAIAALMDALIGSEPELAAQARRLRTVPGIGPASVRLLLGGLPELGQCSAKEIAALVGVAPYHRDSGDYEGQRAIWGGRAPVRSGLYVAGWTAIQHNPIIRSFYERLRARGKPPPLAQIACVRKLVVILNAMARDGTDGQPPAALAA